MTILELYKKHKSGTVSRDKFLYEVRKDNNLPWVTNMTSYEDAVQILKNKGIIREMDANVPVDPAVDLVNPYFLKRGVQSILAKEKELTNDSYVNALNKAAKNLISDPNFYDVDMFANADEVEKADVKLQMEPVKKDNFNNKDREMKKIKGHNDAKANTKVTTKENKKGKPKGVEIMKEAVLDELLSSLKKKDLVNEDVHPVYNVGSVIHTPDGEGTIKEIIGSTFTVEMKDGTHQDWQVNVIDKATEKAKEKEGREVEEAHMSFADAPLDPRYKLNKDGQRALSPDGEEFKVGDEVVAIDNGQKVKIQSFKIEQGKVKAIVNTGMFSSTIDIDGLEKPKSDNPFDKFKGRPFGEAVKKFIEKHKGDKEKMGKLKEAIKKLKEVKALVVPKSATGMQIDKLAAADPTIKPGQQIDIIRK